MLEAILAGRHTICVNFSSQPDPYPYARDGGSLPARSGGELLRALDLAFDPAAQQRLEQDRQRFLVRHAGPSAEGQGADTLAGYVLSLSGTPASPERATP